MRSFRSLLIILTLCLSLLLTWWVQHRAYDWSMSRLKEQGEDRLLSTIIGLRSAIDSYNYLPFLISQNKDVQELLLYPVLDKGAEVSRFLEQMNLVSGATTLMVLDLDGRALSYSRWREEQSFFLRSHAHSPYFTQARNGNQGVYVESRTNGEPASIYLSAPIYDSSRFMGVAVVRIDLDQLSNKLSQLEDFLLIAANERVIMASDRHWQGQLLSTQVESRRESQLDDGSALQLKQLQDGRRVLFQAVELPDLGWQVAVVSDVKPVLRMRNTAALISLGGCLALGLLLLYMRERHLKNLSRQETRDALERNERQQRDIINNAHVGMIGLDASGRISFINPMASQQFGVGTARILGYAFQDLIAGDDESFTVLQRTLSRLGSKGFAPLTAHEVVGSRADGSTFPMMISIKQMATLADMQYLVTVIDITKRKRLEHALQQANDQLEHKVLERTQALQEAQQELVQAEKMAALGRMSSAVVHELNQPLTAMRTYLAICRHLLSGEQAQLAENLELIDDLTQRMALITQQLKTFAVNKPEALVPVKPRAALDQSLVLFRDRIQQDGIELQIDSHEPDLEIPGDNARLEQVFVNLIKNACDAMNGQSEAKILQVQIETDQAQPDSWVRISVADSGPGIPPDSLTHLFDPFYTTKAIGDGLGLGLSIVSSIVQDLGGQISAQNRVEGGARFDVILPRLSETSQTQTENT
ncbi:ATP-binding protein [Pontibacterium sp.]|uniref:sensor histidine kinase n=1 Tax=Pontibacterium sp. TaxID=2036026 RepID=UPI003515A7E1